MTNQNVPSPSSWSKQNWLLFTNAESLFYKLDELRALTSMTKPFFICVTETWFTPDIDNDLIGIPGYQLFRSDRRDDPADNRRGGGTVIYASSVTSPFSVSLPLIYQKPSGFDYSLIGFTDLLQCFLLCIYVPPNMNAESFSAIRNHIVDVLDHLLSHSPNANIFVCGDFNRYDFSFITDLFNLSNIVNFPTYGDNTLDKFFCDSNACDSFSATVAPPLGSANKLHSVIFISKNMNSSIDTNFFSESV